MPKETVLLVCAHSDDQVLGAGGTIARYKKKGNRIVVIILSYGEKSHPWLRPHITKELRKEETKNADKIIGSTSVFFDLEEGNFKEGYKKIKDDLIKIFRKEKPTKVFAHNNEDPHPDHKASYKITLDLLKTTRQKPEVYLFSIWNPFSFRKSHLPKMYVDISDTYSKKLQAIKCFKSQRAALALLLWSIFIHDIKNGLHIGAKFAEMFYRIR